MATAVGLAMQISANTSRLASSLDEVNRRLDKTGKEAKKAAGDLGVLKTLAIGGAVIKGVGALATGLTSAASAALGWANNVRQSIDATGDLAARTGIAVEALQGFQTAANLTGVQGLDKAVQKLSVSIGTAAASGKTEAFTRLGIDFERLQTLSPEDQFRTIAASISELPTSAERAAAAVKIFGKAGVELLPLFEENLAAIEARSQRLGIVLSGDQVSAVQDMNDALDLVKMTFDGIIGQVTANLAPVVTGLTEEFLQFVEGFQAVEGGQIGGGGIADAITGALFDWAEYFATLIDGFIANLSEWASFLQGVGDTFKAVGSIFQTVSDAFTAAFYGIRAALNTFVAAFAELIAPAVGIFSSTGREFTENFAAEMRVAAERDGKIASEALSNAINGRQTQAAASTGPVGSIVSSARAKFEGRNSPEAQAERAAKEQQRLFDRLSANFVSASAEAEEAFGENVPAAVRSAGDEVAKALKEAMADGKIDEAEQKRINDAQVKYNQAITDGQKALKEQKKIEEERKKIQEKIAEKSAEIESERLDALSSLSKESLKATDIRSSEGASTFLRLATGRQDPAIEEYRKQLRELQEMKKELKKLGNVVEIAA